MTKVKLLRQLDGRPEGEVADYPELDAKRLEEIGVVQIMRGDVPVEPEPEPEPEPAQKADEPAANKVEPEPANKAAAKPKGRSAK